MKTSDDCYDYVSHLTRWVLWMLVIIEHDEIITWLDWIEKVAGRIIRLMM